QRFERRNIQGLKAHYQGPKKLKASGKAAGVKKKKTDKKDGKKTTGKAPARRKPSSEKVKSSGPSLVGNSDGTAPLKRRKPAAE
ncbi:MAG: ATP-dependent helicase, partial [Aquabacterium sp.]